MALTPEDVRNKEFTTVRLREGDDEDGPPSVPDHCLKAALRDLKAPYREILAQAYLEERPITEIAGRLGLTANNAAVRTARACPSLWASGLRRSTPTNAPVNASWRARNSAANPSGPVGIKPQSPNSEPV